MNHLWHENDQIPQDVRKRMDAAAPRVHAALERLKQYVRTFDLELHDPDDAELFHDITLLVVCNNMPCIGAQLFDEHHTPLCTHCVYFQEPPGDQPVPDTTFARQLVADVAGPLIHVKEGDLEEEFADWLLDDWGQQQPQSPSLSYDSLSPTGPARIRLANNAS